MAVVPTLKVLFFDVFGTCVAQGPVVANELLTAAEVELNTIPPSVSDEVRAKAKEVGNMAGSKGSLIIAEHGTVDSKASDKQRIELLPELIADCGLIIPRGGTSSSEPKAGEGSLWDESQLEQPGRVWHHLTSWVDTYGGLELLNTKCSTATLSNKDNELIKELVAHSSVLFTNTYSADVFDSYKPNPKLYLGAAEMMGMKPEQWAQVAAHLSGLKGATACGFHTIKVDRPLEEKCPEVREQGIPDLRVEQRGEGFITLAERLGIQLD